mmetsp:Transcript_4569/g.8629  ORF Transcript_4569/g.8629 Transcript_4569/m.8629 type:complete len:377 (-) Transcript_4569:164-1294(-)
MASECNDDLDCENVLVCFTNLTWQANDPTAPSGCLCSSFYGWEGPNCTDFGAQTYLSLFINLVIVLVSATVTLFSFRTGYKLYSVKQGRNFWNATNVTQLYSIIALISICGFRLVTVLILLTPEQNDEFEIGADIGVKFHSFTVADRVFSAVNLVFFTLGTLNLSIMWMEVADSCKRVKALVSSSLSHFRKVVYISQATFVVISIILLTLNMPFLIILATFPYILALGTISYIGQKRLAGVLSEQVALFATSGNEPSTMHTFSNSETQYRRILADIRMTARTLLGFCVAVVVSGIVYALLSLHGWQHYSKPGQISLAALALDFLMLGLLGSCCTVQYYCYRNMLNVIASSKKEKVYDPTLPPESSAEKETYLSTTF